MAIITEYDWENDTMIHATRHTYRATVAEVAARAKAILPEAVNGRVERAVKLVLAQDVTPQADGTIEVGSSTDPLKVYHLVGTTCDCQDFAQGKAPAGWCAHRIAAGIQKRVGEVLPPSPIATTPAPTVEPAPALPETPASANVRVTIAGREVQWTLRDTDEARLAVRLAALLERYPVPAPASVIQTVDTTPQCPQHGSMQPSTKGKGWYCAHKLDDDTWCKSKSS